MKLAISYGLHVVRSFVEFAHDRLAPKIDRLAPAQRVAAVDEQTGGTRTQCRAGLGDVATIV